MPLYNPTGCPDWDLEAAWPSRMGLSWAVSCKGRRGGKLGIWRPPTMHQPALLPVPYCPQQETTHQLHLVNELEGDSARVLHLGVSLEAQSRMSPRIPRDCAGAEQPQIWPCSGHKGMPETLKSTGLGGLGSHSCFIPSHTPPRHTGTSLRSIQWRE